MQRSFNYEELADIEREGQTSGFYVFNEDLFSDNLKRFIEAFKQYYGNTLLGYSYKTNYTPYLCKLAKDLGAYAEVVSFMEYQIAKKIGYADEKVFFNGPFKEYSELKIALNGGVMVNVDNLQELRTIIAIAKEENKTYRIGVRCNFQIEENKDSRFGIDVTSAEFQTILQEQKSANNIEIVGVHCHFSTSKRSLESFRERTKILLQLASDHFDLSSLQYISIGGGFLGYIPPELEHFFELPAPSYEEYAEAVATQFARQFDEEQVTLVIEPGAAVVADTFQYFGKVMDIKEVEDRNYVLINGSYQNVKPIGKGANLPVKVVSKSSSEEKQNVEIVGYTCMEFDRMHNATKLSVAEGDYIQFNNVGAYTTVLKAPFIKEQAPIVSMNSEGTRKWIKRKETVDDVLATYEL